MKGQAVPICTASGPHDIVKTPPSEGLLLPWDIILSSRDCIGGSFRTCATTFTSQLGRSSSSRLVLPHLRALQPSILLSVCLFEHAALVGPHFQRFKPAIAVLLTPCYQLRCSFSGACVGSTPPAACTATRPLPRCEYPILYLS